MKHNLIIDSFKSSGTDPVIAGNEVERRDDVPLVDVPLLGFVTKKQLLTAVPNTPGDEIDVPIGTPSPLFIDYLGGYSQYGRYPSIWVEIYRQEEAGATPAITEQLYMPITRYELAGELYAVYVDFTMTTQDHFRVVIK